MFAGVTQLMSSPTHVERNTKSKIKNFKNFIKILDLILHEKYE